MPTRFDKLDINTLATSLTGFKFKAIKGISGEDVPRVSLPPVSIGEFCRGLHTNFALQTYDADHITNAIGINTIGAWRSELNAVRQVITDRLSTALILGKSSTSRQSVVSWVK